MVNHVIIIKLWLNSNQESVMSEMWITENIYVYSTGAFGKYFHMLKKNHYPFPKIYMIFWCIYINSSFSYKKYKQNQWREKITMQLRCDEVVELQIMTLSKLFSLFDVLFYVWYAIMTNWISKTHILSKTLLWQMNNYCVVFISPKASP